jgi:hypothetical protein
LRGSLIVRYRAEADAGHLHMTFIVHLRHFILGTVSICLLLLGSFFLLTSLAFLFFSTLGFFLRDGLLKTCSSDAFSLVCYR